MVFEGSKRVEEVVFAGSEGGGREWHSGKPRGNAEHNRFKLIVLSNYTI